MNSITRFLAGILVPVTIISGCEGNSQKIPDGDLRDLKRRYSAEEVNYFYETVFYQDYSGVKPSLVRWQEDIRICMQGTGWAGDSSSIKDALKQINALQLPVKIVLTDDLVKSNVVMHFGDWKYLSAKLGSDTIVPFRGIGKLNQIAGGRLVAIVGISNDAGSYSKLGIAEKRTMRHSIILEEITQILGITGDSWKDYRSIFFEGKKNTTQLQPIDKQVIKLLYERSLPAGFTRKMFVEQFGEMLYACDTKRKLSAYVKKHGIPAAQLKRISNNSYPDSLLVRYSGRVFVKVLGDYNQEDLRFCREAIDLLNTATDRFQLEYTPDSSSSDLPYIHISFETWPDVVPVAERAVKIGSLMVSRRIEGNIRIKSGKAGLSQEIKHRLLFTAFYKILGYDGLKNEIVERDSQDRLQFLPGYKDALTLLYNPILADGFLKSDLDEVIRDL